MKLLLIIIIYIPIEWNEMLGRIFHRVIYNYKNKILNTLPISIFYN